MAKKKKKSAKKKFSKIIYAIFTIILITFIIICYFNPELYNKIIGFLNPDEQGDDYTEQTTVYVNELDDAVIHFIDVGQADCIFIELPDGYTVLIDSGDNRTNYNQKVVSYIENLNYSYIDLLIATHTDLDHIGGMDDIFENFDVRTVYRPAVEYIGDHYSFNASFNKVFDGKDCSTKAYGKFLNFINDETFKLNNQTYNTTWKFFNKDTDIERTVVYNDTNYVYKFDFLTPTAKVDDIKYSDANDYSPIIMFEYQNRKIMFTGDAEEVVEEELLTYYTKDMLDVDLLKVGHHGSDSSSSQNFINAVKPEFAVISCGEGNDYYHPHKATLDKYKYYQLNSSPSFNLFRTDNNGNIVFTINSKAVLNNNLNYSLEKTDCSNNFVAPTAR